MIILTSCKTFKNSLFKRTLLLIHISTCKVDTQFYSILVLKNDYLNNNQKNDPLNNKHWWVHSAGMLANLEEERNHSCIFKYTYIYINSFFFFFLEISSLGSEKVLKLKQGIGLIHWLLSRNTVLLRKYLLDITGKDENNLKRCMHPSVQSSTVYNSQNVEAT